MQPRDDLRDELIALMGASRELTAETDGLLAERFLERLERDRSQKDLLPRRTHRRRSPRQVVGALLIAALALAIGTPLSLRMTDNAGPSCAASITPRCSWHTDLRRFASHGVLETWQSSLNPKVYSVLRSGTNSDGTVSARFTHWKCSPSRKP